MHSSHEPTADVPGVAEERGAIGRLARGAAPVIRRLVLLGHLVRFSHSIFALPFALASAACAALVSPLGIRRVAWIIVAMVLLSEVGVFQSVFNTASLTPQMWWICLGAALCFLVVGELFRLILRLALKDRPSY